MKLLAIEMSRVTALFRAERLSGQAYLPHVATQVTERYRFSSAPRSIEELRGAKVEFKHGLFEGNAIEALEVYNDGIIVTSRSDTDFLDKFTSDLRLWLGKDHGFSEFETHAVNRMYDSTLLVETGRDVFKPLDAYAELSRMIENELRASSGLEITYQNYGLALSADQTRNPALKPIPFRFERKEGIDFSHNHFFATAPLKTKQHLKILEHMERLT